MLVHAKFTILCTLYIDCGYLFNRTNSFYILYVVNNQLGLGRTSKQHFGWPSTQTELVKMQKIRGLALHPQWYFSRQYFLMFRFPTTKTYSQKI